MGKEDTRRLKQIMTSAGEEAKTTGEFQDLPGAFVFGIAEVEKWKGD